MRRIVDIDLTGHEDRPAPTRLQARVHAIMLSDLTALRALSFWMATLAGVGFLSYTKANSTPLLTFLVNILPHGVWSAMFLAHAAIRLYGLLTKKRRWLRLFNQMFGASLWMLLLISASLVPPASGLSMLLLSPVTVEAWLMSRELHKWESLDD